MQRLDVKAGFSLSPSMKAESAFLLAALKMAQLIKFRGIASFFNKQDALNMADIVSGLIDTLERLELHLREAAQ
jgi:hypothetical protein